MAKIPLDKYYTPTELAKYCIYKTLELFPNPSEIIEPSAGNGSFSLQIPNCIAYDIEPEHESIIKQDFLDLNLDYKPGRLIIGNPPFGRSNNLAIQFFKKSVQISDAISFILPASQYQNLENMYEFDLVYSEILPVYEYSGNKLFCCLNIYKRPDGGFMNPKTGKKFSDVVVHRWDRGRSKSMTKCDFSMCAWGASVGKSSQPGTYALELHIKINNDSLRDKILDVLNTTDWKSICPSISTPQLPVWRVYNKLKEQIPELK